MQISNFKENGNVLSFSVKDLDVPLANAVRRYSMMHVPLFAIDNIVVYENTSSIFDEYLAHRIGLIPIKMPKKLPSKMPIFKFDMSGPGRIMSQDLKSDSKMTVAVQDIPIFSLDEGQVVRVEGKLKLGIGRTHAKFQAGLVSYGIEDDGTLSFIAEGFHQISVKNMLIRGCDNLLSDISELNAYFSKKRKPPKKATAKKAVKPTKKTPKKAAKKATAKKAVKSTKKPAKKKTAKKTVAKKATKKTSKKATKKK
ncbi:hypothetical protein KAW38_04430 [Candidatus Micrarchaeota archaeon]|nr:hypothetical protein [Candidatus Micrarchaeota archaeon]